MRSSQNKVYLGEKFQVAFSSAQAEPIRLKLDRTEPKLKKDEEEE